MYLLQGRRAPRAFGVPEVHHELLAAAHGVQRHLLAASYLCETERLHIREVIGRTGSSRPGFQRVARKSRESRETVESRAKQSRVAHEKQMPKIVTRDYCEESRTQPTYHVIRGCGSLEQVQDAPCDLFLWPWGRSGPKDWPPPHRRRRPSAPTLSGFAEGFCSPLTRTEPYHPFKNTYAEGLAPPPPLTHTPFMYPLLS